MGEPLIGRLLLYDATTMTFDEVRLRKNPNCPICGEHPTIAELIDYEQFCGMPAHDHSEFATNVVGVPAITPVELKRRLDAGDDLFILDVREPHEWEISNLADLGAVLIPKGQVLEHLGELDTAREIVVQCKTGGRSADIVWLLQRHGFRKLLNLEGGINRWAVEVDTSLPVY
ncbi:MAG TPA: rhodanese-like domain-containing protein [Promineifilum sp.]|nr:rhodanese-like domain-containing protein [Promineifilum sp.]